MSVHDIDPGRGADLPVGARLIEQVLNEGFGSGDLSVVDRTHAPGVVNHQFGFQGDSAEALDRIKAAAADVHGAFPDLSFTIDLWAQHGDITWVLATGRGTATGPFFGPPSGRPIEFTLAEVVRVADGLIVEHWGVPDRFAILAQTGLLERLTAPTGAV